MKVLDELDFVEFNIGAMQATQAKMIFISGVPVFNGNVDELVLVVAYDENCSRWVRELELTDEEVAKLEEAGFRRLVDLEKAMLAALTID